MELRCFIHKWFKDYANWLKYSVEKDTIFCLCRYLYRSVIGDQTSSDCFVSESNLKRKERFDIHVRGLNTAHNKVWKCC